MYIDSGDSLAQKTGSRKLIKKRSTFCPISKSSSSLDYEFLVSGFKIFEANSKLLPFIQHFQARQSLFIAGINSIFSQDYSLDTFALQYDQFGLFATDKGYTYKEYAPHAIEIYLTGDFNEWNLTQYPLVNDGTGIWTLNLNNDVFFGSKGEVIPHLSKVAAYVRTSKNQHVFRVPIGARYIDKLEGKENGSFCELFWNPPEKFIFEHIRPHKPRVFKIYRAEVGKLSADNKILTYQQFTASELERIKKLGYNTILLVGIQQHDLRGNSYSVQNPFAINSNAGDPNQLKSLVDKAHEIGLYVTMDIVQTHASPDQGFNEWDGSHFSYFIEGDEGLHPSGGRLFNFGKIETQRLLLSNLGYFMNEYKIDGFRFHDIPSIIYKNHGLKNIGKELENYFTENASIDGLAYLMLANETVHKINSNAVTFAEDETNYPSLCYPLDEGGIGFDYRIAIKSADKLAEIVCSSSENLATELISLLDDRFQEEKVVASLCYKSSDIILQGIKGQISETKDLAVQRSLSLHKIARMLTLSYGGESYLNRYGNEFGSSEEYLRTDLLEVSPYKELLTFDSSLLQLEEKYQILSMKERIVTLKTKNILAFERADLIFCFNLSDKPLVGYKIGTKWNSDHDLIFTTDSTIFGGLERVTQTSAKVYTEIVSDAAVRPFHLQLDIPPFTGIVLQPQDTEGYTEEQKD